MHYKNQNLNKFVIKCKNGNGQWTYLVNYPHYIVTEVTLFIIIINV